MIHNIDIRVPADGVRSLWAFHWVATDHKLQPYGGV